MKKKITYTTMMLILTTIVNAGIYNPTCTINTPTSDFEIEEQTTWNTQVVMTYSNGPAPTHSMGIQYAEPGSSTWVYMNSTTNLYYSFTNPITWVRCFPVGTCTVNLNYAKGIELNNDYQFRAVCQAGSESKTSSTILINITPETTPPVASDRSPPNNSVEFDGVALLNYSCSDSITQVETIQLWTDHGDGWQVNKTNSSYTEGTILSYEISGMADEQETTWGVFCNDTRGNELWENYTLTTNINATPIKTILLTPTDEQGGLSENVTLECKSEHAGGIDYIELWTNVSGSWQKSAIQTSGWIANNGEYWDVQNGHVRANDAGNVYESQVKMDVTWLNPVNYIESARFCMNPYHTGGGGVDDNITVERVDDQEWTFISITTGEYNSQTTTNQTNTTLIQKDNFVCFDITNIMRETLIQDDTYVSLRFWDPDQIAGTITGLNFFTGEMWLGSASIYTNYAYLAGAHTDEDLPYIEVSYFSNEESTPQFELTELDSGSYTWNCKSSDDDNPPNQAFAPANYTFTVGGIDQCIPTQDEDFTLQSGTCTWNSVNYQIKNLFIGEHASLTITNSNVSMANVTYIGNVTTATSEINRGMI